VRRGRGTDDHTPADRGTVLYIEDNASNVRVLEGVLAHRPGVKLLTAVDAQTGLALAQRDRPGLILLDMHLPDASGEDVLWRLQANAGTRDIPVVALSADATPGRITRTLARGARHYLTKPIDVARLLELFDEYCPEVVEKTRSVRVS
jgi:CheY-like chemotaxis protein